jgi:trimeric autotransporter adhesin
MKLNKDLLAAIFVSGQLLSFAVAAQTVKTFAGTGQADFGGSGGLAIQTGIGAPADVATDKNGNAYILQFYGYRVTKVGPDGRIYNYAGNGIQGFSGDGGPASEAQISDANQIAVDKSGNLYIADFGNNRIRKVDINGVISTIAGNGEREFAGEAVPAISSTIYFPTGIATDNSGSIYFVEYSSGQYGSRVRKIDPAGVMTTVAGNVQSSGWYGDGGPAVQAALNGPTGIAVDKSGNIYIADYNNARIRKVSADGIINTVAGSMYQNDVTLNEIPATSAGLALPIDVSVDDSGNIYIAEAFHVRKVTPDGIIHLFAGRNPYSDGGYAGDGGPAIDASFSYLGGVASDGSGNVYIADAGNLRVRVVNPEVFTTCAAEGFHGSQLALCRQICEAQHSGNSMNSLIKNYLKKFGTEPPCAR